jgi:hypothetical protein
VEGTCEHGIELSGSIKCWGVLEGLHNWRLLKKELRVLLCPGADRKEDIHFKVSSIVIYVSVVTGKHVY